MKILITGARGQLGKECSQVLSKCHSVIDTDVQDLDITAAEAVRSAVRESGPDLIVNCAAYTQVDRCETERDLAWKINVEGPATLAAAVEEVRGRLFHISTDYVFDGRKNVPEPYTEEDATGPLSYYGTTKLAGEKAVKEACSRYAIVRTAWLYGIEGKNILKTFLKLALDKTRAEINVVNDQFGSPTWAYRLALQIAELIETDGRGTFHATSEGYCTWYQLAERFLSRMGVPCKLTPCTTEEYPTPATRPRNSILENRRLKEAGINIMPDWKHDVDEFVALFKDRLLDEAKQQGKL
jgi:dTDP-4-dehydrorhamnose reductase